MNTVQQGTLSMKALFEEGGDDLTGLARALLEAGINEMMSTQADAAARRPRPRGTTSARGGSRRRSAQSRSGYRSCARTSTSRTAWSSGGAGSMTPRFARWPRYTRSACPPGRSGGSSSAWAPAGSPRMPSRASARRWTLRSRSYAPGSFPRCASLTRGSARPTCPAGGAATALCLTASKLRV